MKKILFILAMLLPVVVFSQQAQVKVSDLSTATSVGEDDILYLIQGNVSKNVNKHILQKTLRDSVVALYVGGVPAGDSSWSYTNIDTIQEFSAGHGTLIDGTLIKDSNITTDSVMTTYLIFTPVATTTTADGKVYFDSDDGILRFYNSVATKWDTLNVVGAGGGGGGDMSYSDTAAMLLPYITRADTAAMLLPYMLDTDTTLMLAPYITRGDTAAILSDYALLSEALLISDTAEALAYLNTDIALKLNISDTATMLDYINTDIALRLLIADTTSMLSDYALLSEALLISDTATALAYINTDIALKLNIADTATMLDYINTDIALKATTVGTPLDNQIGIWTGDGTIEGDVDLDFDGLNLNIGAGLTYGASTGLDFGNGGTGFYESGDNILNVKINNSGRWLFTSTQFGGSAGSFARLQWETPTATNPVYIFQGDEDTGMGWASADFGSLIAGGTERLRFGLGGSLTDSISELTADQGVLIESVLIKDGLVDGVDLAVEALYIRDTMELAVFGGGARLDSTVFTDTTLYGAFYNAMDTLVITEMIAVSQGTTPVPIFTVDIIWNDSLHYDVGTASAVHLNTTPPSVSDTILGSSDTSFDNGEIYPGMWVWCETPTMTNKPTFLSVTLIGYKK